VKLLFGAILVVMLSVTVMASLERGVFEAGGEIVVRGDHGSR
jgi:hypothetical protein